MVIFLAPAGPMYSHPGRNMSIAAKLATTTRFPAEPFMATEEFSLLILRFFRWDCGFIDWIIRLF